MTTLFSLIDAQSKLTQLTLGVVLMLGVGYLDYISGLEVAVSIFYLFPVALSAWFVGRWPGLVISLACAVVLFFADLLASSSYSHPIIPYWNAIVLLGFFVVVTLILSALRQSIEHELQLARDIQLGFLPKEMPKVDGFEFSCGWQPSRVVSGDYYDVFRINDAHIGVCIADVIGHGMPAALLMSNLQAAVKIFSSDGITPATLCGKVNKLVCENVEPGKFITFFFASFDLQRKRLIYCNAGHNPPILIRKDGAIERLDKSGLTLGLRPDANHPEGEASCISGDRLVLFSDGLTELTNLTDQQFGEARLISVVQQDQEKSAEELKQAIMRAARDFGTSPQKDDITVVVVAVDGLPDIDGPA